MVAATSKLKSLVIGSFLEAPAQSLHRRVTERSPALEEPATVDPAPEVEFSAVDLEEPATVAPTSGVEFSAVSDVLLVAGVVEADASGLEGTVDLRAGEEISSFPIRDWFAAGNGHLGLSRFRLTVSHTDRGNAVEGRVIVNGAEASPWRPLPSTEPHPPLLDAEVVDSCEACGCTDSELAGSKHGASMTSCNQCGLLYTNPRPQMNVVLSRYSKNYFEDEYLISQSETEPLERHWDSLLDFVDPFRFDGAKLFEIGFGGGGMLVRASNRGWVASGSDVNPAAVEYGKGRGLDVVLGNVDQVDSLGTGLQCIVSEMSLEHLEHPSRAVQLCSDALLPGGCLLIYTVSAEGQSFREAGMASYLVGPREHLYLFTSDSLTRMCAAAGLTVETLWSGPTGDEVGVIAVKPLELGRDLA